MNLLYALVSAAEPGAVVPFVRAAARDAEDASAELELVRGARDGKRTAQHALYVRNYERVRLRILRLLGAAGDVDDVLQDTFVAAFRDLDQLADESRFGAWVCGIAVHQVHRRLRRRSLLRRLGLLNDTDDVALTRCVDPSASPETVLLVKQLDRALSTLAPRERLAWMLRHVEGCSLEEVASQCRVSLATAKRDIGRAELELSAHLFGDGGSDER